MNKINSNSAAESEPRVPTDLRKALAAAPKAKAQWKDLTPIARRDFISWIDSAKTTGDAQTPDRESLLDACGRKATPLIPEFLLTTKFTKDTKAVTSDM
jgi:hypothetical protein